MTGTNLSIEALDAKLSHLSDQLSRQNREICDAARRLVDLESVVRNEHGALREECDDMFGRLDVIGKKLDAAALGGARGIEIPVYLAVPGWEAVA